MTSGRPRRLDQKVHLFLLYLIHYTCKYRSKCTTLVNYLSINVADIERLGLRIMVPEHNHWVFTTRIRKDLPDELMEYQLSMAVIADT